MAFKIRLKLSGTAGARFGGTSDYLDISSRGRLTMAGSGRVYRDLWVPATQWVGIEPKQFVNAFNANTGNACPIHLPYGMDFGNDAASAVQVPVLGASNAASTNARAAAVVFAPPDAAPTGSVAVWLLYTTKLAHGSAGSQQVFRVHSIRLGTGGSALGTLTPGASCVRALTMATVGGGKIESASIGLIDSFSQASPLTLLQLVLESNHTTCGLVGASAEEQIFGVRLRYLVDSLGAA